MAIELKQTYTVLSSEKILNSGFSIDTTFWTSVNCTIASIAGGFIGNCLEITRVIGIPQYAGQIILTTLGKTYRWGVWVKSGTSGDEAFELLLWDSVAARSLLTGISSPIWTYYELDFIPTQISGEFQLRKNSVTPGTMLFDECSVKEVITIYPNMKNKFSKLSKTKIWSLFNQYKNFQPSALWSARNAIISPSNSIWDYLIGWYWNSEGSGNIVYNMAPGNGLAGGGLLPNLNVINLGDYWSVSGYGYSPFDSGYAKAYSYCNFISRLISQNACLGIFINRKDIFTISHQCNVIELTKQNPTLATDYIKMQNLKNPTDYYFDMYWVTYASTTPFVPTINNWYFLFNDDTNIPKLAKPDGTLYTFDGAQIITPTDKLIEKLTLGAYWNGTSFLDGAGALLGDAFLFNNKRLTQAEWGVIYDLCASRYGMSARSW